MVPKMSLYRISSKSITFLEMIQDTQPSPTKKCLVPNVNVLDFVGKFFGGMKRCTPLWREAQFQVKSDKNWRVRSTFGSWDVEKMHAFVAGSTFPSQKCKELTVSDQFWTFRCRFVWQAQGIVHLAKANKRWGLCSSTNYKHHYTTLQLQLQLQHLTLHFAN